MTGKPAAKDLPDPLVLFDGVCNLCHGSVRFVLRRDPKAIFRFASLQSDLGREVLQRHDLPDNLETIVLIEDGQAWTRSTAALRIARHLRAGWPLLYGFVIVPRCLRDAVYRGVARYRYRWFGRKDTCPLPDPSLADRFVDGADSPGGA